MTGSGKFTQVALFVVTRKTVPTRNVEFCFKIVQDDSHFENVGGGWGDKSKGGRRFREINLLIQLWASGCSGKRAVRKLGEILGCGSFDQGFWTRAMENLHKPLSNTRELICTKKLGASFWETLCEASTDRAQRIHNEGDELKVILLDFVYHLRRISRQATIFMCSWSSSLILLPYIFSNFCQKCSQGTCKKNCRKTPLGKTCS